MFSLRMFVAFIFLSSLALNSSLFCQTEVEGNVSGVWDQDGSPYIVNDDIIVPVRDRLEIQPGVEVLFNGEFSLTVFGTLIAVGEEEDSILFSRNDDDISWRRIILDNSNRATRFDFCIIEHSTAPGNYDDNTSRGGGMYCIDCDVTITNSTFRRNFAGGEGGAIYFLDSNPTVTDNLFWLNRSNYNAGCIRYRNSSGNFSRNVVSENLTERFSGGGVFIGSSSSPTLENNVLTLNASIGDIGWGSAVYIEYDSQPAMTGNLIFQNMQGGIFLGGECRVDVFLNNTVVDNNGRAGLLLYRNCILEVVNSIISGNDGGSFEIINSQVHARYSDIAGVDNFNFAQMAGNFDDDPLFSDPEGGDYNLTINSPCIDSGDPESPPDPDGTLPDMGALYFQNAGVPEILIEPREISTEESSEHVVNITNMGEDFLIWSVLSDVEWVTFEPVRGVLSNAEDEDIFFDINAEGLADPGLHRTNIVFRTNDLNNLQLILPVTLSLNVGDSPFWTDIPAQVRGQEGDEIAFRVMGEDPDGDDLEISVANLWNGAQFFDNGDGTGDFLWQTDFLDAGDHRFTFILSDNFQSVEAAVWIFVENLNRPPEWQELIPDIELTEDDGLIEVGNINQLAEDPDNDELVFDLGNGDGIEFGIINDVNLIVITDDNWNGETWISISASDGEFTISDTAIVRIVPVNDPPEMVSLLSPENDTVIHDIETILFEWTPGVDIDNDLDELTYSLVITSENGSYSRYNLPEPVFEIELGLLRNILNNDENVEWRVCTSDGVDSTGCEQPFSFTLEPDNVKHDNDNTAEVFELISAYPNPFNDSVNLTYSTDRGSVITLAVYSTNGNLVEVLKDEFHPQGKYEISWAPKKYPASTYLIKLERSGEMKCTKVILAR